MEEIPFMDMLKEQLDRDQIAPAKQARTAAYTTATLPAAYDLRRENLSTSVKEQKPLGTCWAFGATAAVESNYLKQTGIAQDFSEKHLAYFTKHVRPAGLEQAGEGLVSSSNTGAALEGGQPTNALGTYAAWQGPVLEADVPYTDDNGTLDAAASWTVDEAYRTVSLAHLRNAELIPSPANWKTGTYVYDGAAVQQMKEAIYTYGAISAFYYVYEPASADEMHTVLNYWNQQYGSYYTTGNQSPNHVVTVIGWDDNFSRDHFNGAVKPAGNGAFLIKNSWGTDPSTYDYMNAIPNDAGGKDYGYFWISYYDESLSVPVAYEMDAGEDGFDYDNIEQYDYLGVSSPLSVNQGATQVLLRANGYTAGTNESVANVFTADDYVTLEAVSLFSNQAAGVTADIAVYVNGEAGNPESGTLAAEQQAVTDSSGFYTIDLDQPAALQPGDTYAIVQTIRSNSASGDNYLPLEIGYEQHGAFNGFTYAAVSNPGESYVSAGGQWLDVSDLTPLNTTSGTARITVTAGNAMIKAYTSDRQATAAETVIAMIDRLGTVTSLAQEQAVAEARAAFNALTAAQQARVTNLAALEAAEQAIQTLKAQTTATPADPTQMTNAAAQTGAANANIPATGDTGSGWIFYTAAAASAAATGILAALRRKKSKKCS